MANKVLVVDDSKAIRQSISFVLEQNGYEVLEAPMPCLVTVSSEVGLPRLPTGVGIITAARKQIPTWTAQDIEADLSQAEPEGPLNEIISLSVPVREDHCEIVTGETAAEAAVTLASKLKELNIV